MKFTVHQNSSHTIHLENFDLSVSTWVSMIRAQLNRFCSPLFGAHRYVKNTHSGDSLFTGDRSLVPYSPAPILLYNPLTFPLWSTQKLRKNYSLWRFYDSPCTRTSLDWICFSHLCLYLHLEERIRYQIILIWPWSCSFNRFSFIESITVILFYERVESIVGYLNTFISNLTRLAHLPSKI